MIGNDVVDLAQRGVQPGALHPRFDARVFAQSERELIASDGSPRLRWVLWAAKEAAYKVAKKLDPAVVWAPSRFVVSLETKTRGSVAHGARRFALRVEETAELVHALATDRAPGESDESSGVARAEGDDLSAAARAYACSELAARLGVSARALSVAKHGRVPVLCVDGAPARADLSLSHHGRFVAFACQLEAAALARRLAS